MEIKPALAELIGTFTLVFIGAAASAQADATSAGLTVVALATNDLHYFWMYLVGPLAGGAVAGLLFSQFFMVADQPPKRK